MGCFSTYEEGQFQNGRGSYPVQYILLQNQYNVNQEKNQEENKNEEQTETQKVPKPEIKIPAPKLFEFDTDFFKGVENIEKSEFNGIKAEGQTKNGLLDGKNRVYYANGDIYEGEFKEDFRHGKGIYKYKSGNVYNGDWNKNQREGWGIMKFPTSYYEGEWKADKTKGKGKMIWTGDCETYEGEFKDNKRHGKGKYEFSN